MHQMAFTNARGYFSKGTSLYFPCTLAVSVSHDRIQFPLGQVGSNDNVLSWRWKLSLFTAPSNQHTHAHTHTPSQQSTTWHSAVAWCCFFFFFCHGIVLTHVHHSAAICKPLAVWFAGVLWSRARASRRIQQHRRSQSSWGKASETKRGEKVKRKTLPSKELILITMLAGLTRLQPE